MAQSGQFYTINMVDEESISYICEVKSCFYDDNY